MRISIEGQIGRHRVTGHKAMRVSVERVQRNHPYPIIYAVELRVRMSPQKVFSQSTNFLKRFTVEKHQQILGKLIGVGEINLGQPLSYH